MSKRMSKSVRLGVAALDNRVVPTVSVVSGAVHIDGGAGNDVVTVNYDRTRNSFVITENGVTTYINAHNLSNTVFFNGNDGNDYLRDDGSGVKVLADGGNGNDTLIGGNYGDRLVGDAGADYLDGRDGNDYLYGGYLGSSQDYSPNTVYGGAGNDYIRGGAAADKLLGNSGDDQLFGGSGNDAMYGGYGQNRLFGEGGNDVLNAQLYGSSNYMEGGSGNDTMNGGYGSDNMLGQGGLDVLNGGAGDDDLNGGDDGFADVLTGGGGRDRFQQDLVTANGVTINLDQPTDFSGLYDLLYNQ